MKSKKTLISNSLEDTKKFAEKIASKLKGGEVIALVGDLGAGKTYLTKFLVEALGGDLTEVISPTYIYHRQYEGDKFLVNHFDMYRIDSVDEVDSVGLLEALEDKDAITIIEWADKVREILPKKTIWIEIESIGETEREFRF